MKKRKPNGGLEGAVKRLYKAKTKKQFEALAKHDEVVAYAEATLTNARPQRMKIPKDLTPDQADQLVQHRLSEVAPHALQTLEEDLFSEDVSTKRAAAKDWLDRAGHAKRNQADQVGAAPMVIVKVEMNSEGKPQLPWLKREDK